MVVFLDGGVAQLNGHREKRFPVLFSGAKHEDSSIVSCVPRHWETDFFVHHKMRKTMKKNAMTMCGGFTNECKINAMRIHTYTMCSKLYTRSPDLLLGL